MIRLREADVASAVSSHLENIGFSVIHQFPMLGKLVDIYAIRVSDQMTVAVECKERDWRRAAAQARVGGVISNNAYVAMPAAMVSDAARAHFAANGLGLFVVGQDRNVLEALQPQGPTSQSVLRGRAARRFYELALLRSVLT